MFLRALTVLTSSILALAVAFVTAHATPITLIDHLNNFRDTRGVNDVGVPPGDAIQFGADVTPGGLQGTTLGAVQGTRVLVPTVCPSLQLSIALGT
jgi:hypothetical protein